MPAQPPLLDPRRFEELRDAVARRATELAPTWRPGARDDVGAALAAIFAHDLELILQRLNRVPEKNLLAFLDLIGVGLLPPGAARGPLVFQLTDGAGASGLVPAGTQVATLQTETQPAVIFETEQDLSVAAARLVASFTIDPTTDRYGDWTPVVTGQRRTVFEAFRGDRPIEHSLYLGLDRVLRLRQTARLTLLLHLATEISAATVEGLLDLLRWETRTADGWEPLAAPDLRVSAEDDRDGLVVRATFDAFPSVELLPLGRPEAVPPRVGRWLRASTTTPMLKGPGLEAVAVTRIVAEIAQPSDGPGIPPDQVHVNQGTADFSKPFQAFGPDPKYGDTMYVASDEALAGAEPGSRTLDGTVQIHLDLGQSDVTVAWEHAFLDGNLVAWKSADARDQTAGFTVDGGMLQVTAGEPISFLSKDRDQALTVLLFRARLVSGRYSRVPLVRQLVVVVNGQPLIPLLGFTSDTPLDLLAANRSIDLTGLSAVNLRAPFFPFGTRPEPGHTLYVMVVQDEAHVFPRDPVVLLALPSVRVAWEYLSRTGWRSLGESSASGAVNAVTPGFGDTTRALTASGGIVSFDRPADLERGEVNGVRSSWVRAQLRDGSYGRQVELEQVDPDDPTLGFRIRPGTGAVNPPVVAAISLTYTAEERQSAILAKNGFRLRDPRQERLAQADKQDVTFHPFEPVEEPAPTLYIGFDRGLPRDAVNLLFAVPPRQLVEPLGERAAAGGYTTADRSTVRGTFAAISRFGAKTLAVESAAPVRWEYWNGHAWVGLIVADGTSALTESGIVRFLGPPDLAPLPGLDDVPRSWIRIVRTSTEEAYEPTLAGIFVNAVDAVQATTIQGEVLGSSTGGKRQLFRFARRPVFGGQQVVVAEPEMPPGDERAQIEREEGRDAVQVVAGPDGLTRVWVRWHEVPTLAHSGPGSRHYTLDRITGEVRFGDGLAGLIPPEGRDNVVGARYRAGGGPDGNQPAGAVSVLKSSIPYVATATNPIATDGGSTIETIADVQARGPRTLAHRGRAVTADDYEWLARQAAGTRVARTRCLPNRDRDLRFAPGWVTVVIVPAGPEPKLLPSAQLIRDVEDDLAGRVMATLLDAEPAQINVVGPGYVPVELAVSFQPVNLVRAEEARAQVRAALDAFLHPLTGGPDRTGWPFGRDVFLSELFAVLEALPSVEHVHQLDFRPTLATLPLLLTTEVVALAEAPIGTAVNVGSIQGALAEPLRAGQRVRSAMVVVFREGERIAVGERGQVVAETTVRAITGSTLLVEPFQPATDVPAGTIVGSVSGQARAPLAVALAAEAVVDRLVLQGLDPEALTVALPGLGDVSATSGPIRRPIPQPVDAIRPSETPPARRAVLGRRLRVPESYLVYPGEHRVEIRVE